MHVQNMYLENILVENTEGEKCICCKLTSSYDARSGGTPDWLPGPEVPPSWIGCLATVVTMVKGLLRNGGKMNVMMS